MCGHVSLLCLCLLFVSSSVQGGQENLPSTWTTIVREDAQARLDEGTEKTFRMFAEQLSSCNSKINVLQTKLVEWKEASDETCRKNAEHLAACNSSKLEKYISELNNKSENLLQEISISKSQMEAAFTKMSQERDLKYNEIQSNQREILKVLEAMKLKPNVAGLEDMVTLGGRKYYFSKKVMMNWYGAKNFCNSHGLHLASIESYTENQLIFNQKSSLGMPASWIGGTDEDVEGTWRWIGTGQSLTYKNWQSGEPNGGRGKNCMEMGYNSKFWAYPCSTVVPFICEQSG